MTRIVKVNDKYKSLSIFDEVQMMKNKVVERFEVFKPVIYFNSFSV